MRVLITKRFLDKTNNLIIVNAGSVLTVSDERAQVLIENGFATPVVANEKKAKKDA